MKGGSMNRVFFSQNIIIPLTIPYSCRVGITSNTSVPFKIQSGSWQVTLNFTYNAGTELPSAPYYSVTDPLLIGSIQGSDNIVNTGDVRIPKEDFIGSNYLLTGMTIRFNGMKYYSSSAGDDWGYASNIVKVTIEDRINGKYTYSISMNPAIGISASTGSISINDQFTSYNRVIGISVSADLVIYKSK